MTMAMPTVETEHVAHLAGAMVPAAGARSLRARNWHTWPLISKRSTTGMVGWICVRRAYFGALGAAISLIWSPQTPARVHNAGNGRRMSLRLRGGVGRCGVHAAGGDLGSDCP